MAIVAVGRIDRTPRWGRERWSAGKHEMGSMQTFDIVPVTDDGHAFHAPWIMLFACC